jgi:hypothetical protein
MRRFAPLLGFIAFLSGSMSNACFAGQTVPIEEYLQSLQEQEKKLNNLEAKLSEHHEQIDTLQRELEAVERALSTGRTSIAPLSRNDPGEVRRRELRRQAQDLRAAISLRIKQVVPIEQAITSGRRSGEIFPNVANKIAAVTYDSKSPQLGDDISFIVSKHLLYSSNISSFAVVNFQSQGFNGGGIQYFDLVEQLTTGHHFNAALWGRIFEFGDTIQIDTFLQIPQDVLEHKDGPFVASVTLPDGQGQLRASVRPDRVQLQSLIISKAEAASFQEAAANIRQLREQPRSNAAVVGEIPADGKYFVAGRSGDWIKLGSPSTVQGWTSVHAFCSQEACKKLLRAAGFANDLVAAGASGRSMQGSKDLSRAALDFLRQFNAIRLLKQGAPERAAQLVLDRPSLNRCSEPAPTDDTCAGSPAVRPLQVRAIPRPNSPTEVSFANIYYLAQLAKGGVNKDKAKDAAGELAKAVLNDPNNKEILSNLKAIFSYTGDSFRSRAVDEILRATQ